ncbi:hypothetical protein BDW74DRAFT_152761 [Aspergillus multicolor]|uniref:uncharacterized protein n=1 Tax=Aspergillus multicolor TaxID=41759 RepID=UPI003CCE0BAC
MRFVVKLFLILKITQILQCTMMKSTSGQYLWIHSRFALSLLLPDEHQPPARTAPSAPV